MAPNTERRRHRRTKPLPGQQDLTIIYQTEAGPNVIGARLLDFSAGGISVEISEKLPVGASVEIVGEIEGGDRFKSIRRRGFVRWCSVRGGGFVVGLSFQPIADGASREQALKDGESVDYYEVLQLSRNANPDTIQRVFRILAKRYHPDNRETGDAELFCEILEAARVLLDPELRAAYDARLGAQSESRYKVFETSQSSRGVEAEKPKRKAVLALYGRRLIDPEHPTLGLRDLEAMLECPREHLEFTLRFLKENKWIKGADNARYEITIQGVLAAEADETFPLPSPVLQLHAPKEGGRS